MIRQIATQSALLASLLGSASVALAALFSLIGA